VIRQSSEAVAPDYGVVLNGGIIERIRALSRQGYPDEVCGLLIGRADGAWTRVEALSEAVNRAPSAKRRFLLDPDDFLAAELRARKTGRDVVGVWHSHPDHPALPSPTDLEHAWPGYSYVIVAVTTDGLPEVRSWRLHDGRFVEERLQS
jgi:proteasome lid subunit RPN8/RPN11